MSCLGWQVGHGILRAMHAVHGELGEEAVKPVEVVVQDAFGAPGFVGDGAAGQARDAVAGHNPLGRGEQPLVQFRYPHSAHRLPQEN